MQVAYIHANQPDRTVVTDPGSDRFLSGNRSLADCAVEVSEPILKLTLITITGLGISNVRE